ncbi:MAG: hypothetical protein AB1440_05615 [Pseudomonadota bacterium]
MNKWLLMASTAAVAAVATFFVLQSDFNPFDSAMNKACETVIKERLRSPSGYKRIEVVEAEAKPLSLEDFLKYGGYDDGDTMQALYTKIYNSDVANNHTPKMLERYISYDAPNGYGVPIRSTAICQLPSEDGNASNASSLAVIVDGSTSTDWLAEQIRQQQQKALGQASE